MTAARRDINSRVIEARQSRIHCQYSADATHMTESWNLLSNDPNSPVAQKARQAALAQARAPASILDREQYLSDLVAGLKVLDVGVVAHTPEACQSPAWLHRRLSASASSCLGCDILEREVARLRELGFDVVCHDICREPLDDLFDIIVCGELIEHVDRPGALFENCAKMLSQGGKLALSTPNPWFLTYTLKGLFNREPLIDSVDHVAWYDPATLFELGMRHGFRLARYTDVRVTRTYSRMASLLFSLARPLIRIGMRREAFAKSIIYEFVKE